MGDIRKDWRDQLRVGDVILSNRGTQRVIRAATYDQRGFLIAINLVIKHCSWTGRCYTTYVRNDLRSLGFHRSLTRVKLKSRLDKKIASAIKNWNKRPYIVNCCQVHGIA